MIEGYQNYLYYFRRENWDLAGPGRTLTTLPVLNFETIMLTAEIFKSVPIGSVSQINFRWEKMGLESLIENRNCYIHVTSQVPIFVGYSSLRVYDGKLTHPLTFFHRPADDPPVNKSAVKPSPPIPARGPHCLEQKQRLMKLKQEGYTGDEVVIKFPDRKRSNFQAIYSKSLKDLRSLGSQHNHPPHQTPILSCQIVLERSSRNSRQWSHQSWTDEPGEEVTT